jgi:hypothetical protein
MEWSRFCALGTYQLAPHRGVVKHALLQAEQRCPLAGLEVPKEEMGEQDRAVGLQRVLDQHEPACG